MIHLCWFTFKWGLLLAAVVALVAGPYLYHRMDEEIRRNVEALLAKEYPHLAVSVRSAQLVTGQGIEVRGLSIFEPGASGPQAELLYLDEMFVFCNTDLRDLISGKLDISRFAIRRPTLRVTRRWDGSWSAGKLLPLPKLSSKPPVATIEGGVVEILDPVKNPSSTLSLRDVNLKVEPTAPTPGGQSPGLALHVQGRASGDHARQIEIDAAFDPTGTAWQVMGSVIGLEISPELCRAMPCERSPKVVQLEGVRGQAAINFRLTYNARNNPPLDYEVAGQIARARVDDPRLPYPLTDVRAVFRSNRQGCTISDMTARSGPANLRLDAQCTGAGTAGPMRVKIETDHLALDAKLFESLPEALRTQWHYFLPSGEINVRAQLDYDGRTWQPDITVQCLNVGMSYHKFPYRLERARGTVELKQQQLKMNLAATSDAAEVRVVGEMQLTSPVPSGWVEVRGEKMRLDEKFLQALPAQPASIVRSLNPYGTFNFYYRFWQGPSSRPEIHQNATMTLNRCALKYDKFPYPLEDVRGVIEMQDASWSFRDLQGTNGSAHVRCDGELVNNNLTLRFNGLNVPLDDELRDALSPGAQQFWSVLKPRGNVNIDTEMRILAGESVPRLWIKAQPVEGSVSVEPTYFPYKLEAIQGNFIFADDKLVMDQVKGRHGATEVLARGRCDLRPGSGWNLHFDYLSIDRLRFERDLVQALPAQLKKLVTVLHLGGPMNLRGELDIASRGVEGEPITSRWNVQADLHQSSLDWGARLDNISGGISLAGGFDGRKFYCQGDVDFDSLMFKEFQFTEVMGPFWIDDTQLLLGMWADRARHAQPERRMTCKLFGGTVLSDGWVTFLPQPRYNFEASLAGADLARLTKEAIPGRQPLSGTILANVELRGKGSSLNDLGGRGTIQLRNADIYQLPLMVSLLKLLSVRPPDTTAFTRSDINFYIQGQHIYVDRIDFSGDAISLLGKGEVGFDKHIRLTFHAMVGRNENRMPILKDVLGGASQQIMLIHAEGSLDQPSLRREAFPGVNQALQQLQAEFQTHDATQRTAGGAGTQPPTDFVPRN